MAGTYDANAIFGPEAEGVLAPKGFRGTKGTGPREASLAGIM